MMKWTKRRGFGVALLLGLFAPVALGAEPAPVGITQVRAVGAITEYQLDSNGLQILLMPMAAQPQTTVSVMYRVGSRHEGAGEAGMAHLLEHVTFHGTRRFPDLASEMQRLSVRFNGTTSLDRTDYTASFAPNELTLRQHLQLEASRMSESLLSAADFAKEKPIVLNEMGLRGSSTTLQLRHAMAAAMFRQHPYGRPVIGYTADIENLSLPTLRAFYERHYRPDNAVLLISGAFEPAQALTAIGEAFGGIARPATPLLPTEQVEPQQQAARFMTVRTRETALGVAYRVPGWGHPHAPALMLLGQLLPRTNSRLTQNPARPVTLTLFGNGPFTRDPFLLGFMAQLPLEVSDDAKSRATLEDLEETWLARLQDSRRNLATNRLIRQLATEGAALMRKRMNEPASASAMLSDAVGAGDWRLPFKMIEGLDSLTPEAVYEVASLYLRDENRSVVRGVTDRSVIGEQFKEVTLSGFARLFSRQIEVPVVKDPASGIGEIKGIRVETAGTALATDPVELDKATRRYLLPSGLVLGVLQKHSAADQVNVQLTLRWGTAEGMASLNGWRALGGMLDDGVEGRTAAEIRNIKRELQAEIRVLSGPQQLTAFVSTKKTNLLPVLLLLKEQLSAPRLPDEAFARERGTALSRLASAARGAGGSTALAREREHRNQGLSLGQPGYVLSAEELAAIWRQLSVEEVREFQRRYWSGNKATVAVVGNLPEGLMAAVEKLFGEWKKPEAPAFERPSLEHRPESGARFVSSATTPGSAIVALHQELPLNRESDDYYPLLIGTHILAANGVASGTRLADRLRAQDAISYAVSSQLRVPSEGSRASLRLQATGAPASAAQVEASLKEEVARALADGFSEAEVDKARRDYLDERRRVLGSDAGLGAALANQIERKTVVTFVEEQAREDERLAAVTPQQVVEVLRRLLKPEAWVVTVTGALPS